MPTPNDTSLTSEPHIQDENTLPASDPLRHLTPLPGCLIPLKTVQELRAVEETAEAYVVEIPLKSANEAVNLLKTALPPQDPAIPLYHLRRFAKASFLPTHLQPSPSSTENTSTIHLLIPCLEASITLSHLSSLLSPLTSAPLRQTFIPLTQPTSTAQAEFFSQRYWPCVYNPASHAASYAPPPFLITQTRNQIEERVGWYLNLAETLGTEAKSTGRGRDVGVVVVDTDIAPESNNHGVVVGAGDARWWPAGRLAETPQGAAMGGRPEQHAVMRAISLIAQLRLSQASFAPLLTPLEEDLVSIPNNPLVNGTSTSTYLCTNLSIYVTHEPCTCCSMAILHSRFRNVVFRRRMIGTGALTAEVGGNDAGEGSRGEEDGVRDDEGRDIKEGKDKREGLGYGLFWRKELNWRVLGWEYQSEINKSEPDAQYVNSSIFHA